MIDFSQLSDKKLDNLSNFFFTEGYQGVAINLFYRYEPLQIDLSSFSYEELERLKIFLYKLDELELASQVKCKKQI